MNTSDKIVITGGAGLVGQNLIVRLKQRGFTRLVAIDKHPANTATLRRLHPDITVVEADLAEPGAWENAFAGASTVVLNQAQIGGLSLAEFQRNNVTASQRILDVVRGQPNPPFIVHVSSSVVNSRAVDFYTATKTEQEKRVLASGLPCTVLRPTLMFGWFDPKHLGWLARFMERTPVFPIPGHGRYMRQPLYNRDFCRALVACMRTQPAGAIYDLTGPDRVDYIDMIRAIRDAKDLRTLIVRIPYRLFDLLLRVYALFSARPPFTASQLKALTAGDDFTGVDLQATFGFRPTPFRDAIRETFGHPVYSSVVLESTH